MGISAKRHEIYPALADVRLLPAAAGTPFGGNVRLKSLGQDQWLGCNIPSRASVSSR
jgi:hypothetical protein